MPLLGQVRFASVVGRSVLPIPKGPARKSRPHRGPHSPRRHAGRVAKTDFSNDGAYVARSRLVGV